MRSPGTFAFLAAAILFLVLPALAPQPTGAPACAERVAMAADQPPAMGVAAPLPLGDNDTVYVTKTGEKFHRNGCRYLRKTKIALKKGEAVRMGYTPCKVCKP